MDAHALDCTLDEIVAVLPPDDGGIRIPGGVTVLLRTADGRLQVRQLPAPELPADGIPTLGVVHRGKPIVDPLSREVVGYEMVAAPTAS
jgi:hypothetical protein